MSWKDLFIKPADVMPEEYVRPIKNVVVKLGTDKTYFGCGGSREM